MQYRGRFDCACEEKELSSYKSNKAVEWYYKEHQSDDLVLQFQFRDIPNEISRTQERQSTFADKKGFAGTHEAHFMKLHLETNPDTIADVHDNARKFVSILGVLHSDFYNQLDEALKEETRVMEQKKLELELAIAAAAARK